MGNDCCSNRGEKEKTVENVEDGRILRLYEILGDEKRRQKTENGIHKDFERNWTSKGVSLSAYEHVVNCAFPDNGCDKPKDNTRAQHQYNQLKARHNIHHDDEKLTFDKEKDKKEIEAVLDACTKSVMEILDEVAKEQKKEDDAKPKKPENEHKNKTGETAKKGGESEVQKIEKEITKVEHKVEKTVVKAELETTL
mmetsp:Transcript_62951/g.73259  ORF Transcript_62951/g.73259 Transcript_62951/m.73259 type:complete len:196 (-) Transcript_62951:143-730(-)|eukprot:CAMPEP_0176436012 /NCGR_PEP_ID=MMETSP0127-20121128/17685_1 /TAXON_ID=938130 /ORGANISM="Platyophrya macrostoma, Strain WH" /LENGTH=195 /DNA_ID=CAMNT_0017819191 /DNA_START=30 /DNA_END=617 /DNA_ORIENTATION=-